ncbi:MAG: BamA/TamA family outer membrane protein [Proteobacteria bacterium]|nr:BamA/TamA family outer membrane protein [Pseudomonadota bacterium]
MKRFLFFCFILVLSSTNLTAIERRRSQFLSETGYLIVPAPYSLPGIGTGMMAWGSGNNLVDTYIDIYGYLFTGDAKGSGFGIDDLHLVSKTLMLGLGRENITKATIMNYSKRGMDTEKDEYRLLEASDIYGNYGQLTLSFFDRMLEIYGEYYSQTARLDRIRDSEGNVIVDIADPEPQRSESLELGILVDYTDDRQDPRQGFRLDTRMAQSAPDSNFDPAYYSLDINATGFVPVGEYSTLVFNLFRSDAIVTREGETDPVEIARNLGIDCTSIVDPTQKRECEQTREELMSNTYAGNKYGTAASLGGRSRLRAYPGSRFIGAHTLFMGTELRWNITDEFTPFDWWIMKDVRTAVQFAAFYELGSVADATDELGDQTRSSYGSGFRIVTGSGLVYRVDLAYGDEGPALTMIANYPWQ